MDWRSPIAAVIPGLEGVALQQLYRVDTPQSAAEVHRRAGIGSLNGLRYALERLADQGVVDVSTVGRSVAYRINRDHVVYPAIEAAFEALDPWSALASRLRRLVEDHGGDVGTLGVVSLAVFGSVARRDAGVDSDLDLLLVVRDDPESAGSVDALIDALHRAVPRWTGNEAHVLRTTETALARSFQDAEPIALSWMQDAVTVVGPDVRELMRVHP